jgi:hypothetical protein
MVTTGRSQNFCNDMASLLILPLAFQLLELLSLPLELALLFCNFSLLLGLDLFLGLEFSANRRST